MFLGVEFERRRTKKTLHLWAPRVSTSDVDGVVPKNRGWSDRERLRSDPRFFFLFFFFWAQLLATLEPQALVASHRITVRSCYALTAFGSVGSGPNPT